MPFQMISTSLADVHKFTVRRRRRNTPTDLALGNFFLPEPDIRMGNPQVRESLNRGYVPHPHRVPAPPRLQTGGLGAASSPFASFK